MSTSAIARVTQARRWQLGSTWEDPSMDLLSVPGKDQGSVGRGRSVTERYEQEAEASNHLPNPPQTMLRLLTSRLQGEVLFWSVTLLVLLIDDAATLALIFS